MGVPAAITITPETPDRYTRRGILGVGGIGMVELAFDTHLGREVAIKRLKPALSRDTSLGRDATRRFLKEARIGALLEHPNIVPVYELGRRTDGALYYTMKRIRGRTLAEALAGADLDARLAFLPHVIATCNAMAYAHEHGVIHRDLKPDNVMVDAHGEALVVDWGLACERGADDVQSRALAQELEALRKASGTQTVTGAPIGTPAYMPPEQARGELAAIDERSDVYTLGAILYELLTGAPPFTGQSALHILRRVLDAEPVDPPELLEPEAPKELAAVALRALAKNPADRYANAAALAADLVAFDTGARVTAHAYGRGALAWRWLKSHRLSVGAACLLAVAAGVTWYTRGVADARDQVQASTIESEAEVKTAQAILEQARHATAVPTQRRAWAARLAALQSAAVTDTLIEALHDSQPIARQVAAEALASHGSAAVEPLIKRLGQARDLDEQVALIESLGVLGDARADGPVHAARVAAGIDSPLWRRTAAASRLIPVEPAADDGASARIAYAERLASRDALAAAIAALEGLNDPAASAVRGRLFARRGQWKAALTALSAALRARPDDAGLRLLRAQALHRNEAYDEALRDLDRLAARGAWSPAAQRTRAWTTYVLGDEAAGLMQMRRAIAMAPADPLGHLELARLLMADGGRRLSTAASSAASLAIAQALSLAPRHAPALRLRARLHARAGHTAAAAADLRTLLRDAPDDIDAIGMQAAWLRADGQIDAARRLLDASIERRPDDARRVQQRAALHANTGNLRAALADLDSAVQQSDPATHAQLLALAVAALIEAPARVEARLVALRPEGASPWVRDLVTVLRGEAEVFVLGGRHRHDPARACEAALVRATRARLMGDRVAADDLLAPVADLPDLDRVPCALARGLSRH